MFFFLLYFSITVSAQVLPSYPGIKAQLEKNKNSGRDWKLRHSNDTLFQHLLAYRNSKAVTIPPQAKFLIALPNGSGLYGLPQDNMACIKPDMSQFNMPNPGRKIKITGMPLGLTPPLKIIPDKN